MVVALTAPDEELVRRLSARWECPTCRRVYNALSAPSKDGRHCDDHPDTVLGQRDDDTEATVKRHLANAYRKLDVNHRTEAMLRANELNLL